MTAGRYGPQREDRTLAAEYSYPLQDVFERTRHAMVVVDDERRYVEVNDAACSLLRAGREQLLALRIDDLTPPERRAELEELWRSLLEHGSLAGSYELLRPDGTRLEVDYSATANVAPGRHLSVILSPVESGARPPRPAGLAPPPALTPREREVLGLIALGATSAEIAERLVITRDTARTHAQNAMAKLGARSRAHAVALALTHRLIEL